ncbi:IclR family transcriptional regulator [Nesterenkonia alba]|uniref:IclR family transcriptional regulator n=1 Tax=Nesterenkonia alba TaxID=515814 RepID=UPI0003B3C05B|nr:IclR family transcriptional regulator [Nesterenkonia alba]
MSEEKAARRASTGEGAVKSAVRALAILDLLAQRGAPMRFPEIVRELGYPQSSLHALIKTLHAAQWVEFDESTREYTLGIRAWEAGNAYQRALSLAERAQPFMNSARDELNETIQLAVLDGGRHNVYLAKAEGDQRLVLESHVGGRLPAHATGVGKVLLAALEDTEVRRRIGDAELEQYTETTIKDIDELLEHLRGVRQRGYATDHEEYTVGVRCVAVPVKDHRGTVVAAMSVSVPVVRFTEEFEQQSLKVIQRAAEGFSAALGHR